MLFFTSPLSMTRVSSRNLIANSSSDICTRVPNGTARYFTPVNLIRPSRPSRYDRAIPTGMVLPKMLISAMETGDFSLAKPSMSSITPSSLS
ncbi:hypothetical protein D3C76_971790 [compost metagenome]